jgi:hypothetical protein
MVSGLGCWQCELLSGHHDINNNDNNTAGEQRQDQDQHQEPAERPLKQTGMSILLVVGRVFYLHRLISSRYRRTIA